MDADVEIRPLRPEELTRVGEIDRTEHIEVLYDQRGTELVPRRGDFSSPGWIREGDGEHTVRAQVRALDFHVGRGGVVLGALVASRLVGIGVVVPEVRPGIAQLAWLHVSNGFRDRGLGTRLCDQLDDVARAGGATRMVVSATPSEHTIHFYRGRGFEPMAEPLPELFELEPEDIHLDRAL